MFAISSLAFVSASFFSMSASWRSFSVHARVLAMLSSFIRIQAFWRRVGWRAQPAAGVAGTVVGAVGAVGAEGDGCVQDGSMVLTLNASCLPCNSWSSRCLASSSRVRRSWVEQRGGRVSMAGGGRRAAGGGRRAAGGGRRAACGSRGRRRSRRSKAQ